MKAYEIIGAMEDTLDIFLESEGTESDKEWLCNGIFKRRIE